ncbi:uncharacterized protein LOC129340264 isoform X2 [Eublepharis macularius]|uniref:Uncharacterized protein LOC129340264 isoform X2 n=1 Tax=Eublepharis macularius TaxID=481883 RepID=A0AA97K9G5_EUBMA|nr:uncharacterized protein LOC129340264 isoform X2 [Eublepharis macularius]
MEQLFLVPILVFLHAEISPASTAGEQLISAQLSVNPSYRQYYEGDNIDLICTAKINKPVKGYRFFNESKAVIHEMDLDGFGNGWLPVKVQKEKAGKYSCGYWTGEIDKEVRSPQSNIITLQVTEAPKKPSLTLNHTLPQYKWGDSVNLVCSAPNETKDIKEFQYYGDRQTIQAISVDLVTDTYNLNIIEPKDTGNFMCAYIQLISGRNVRSEKSDPVFIDPAGTNWGRILATGGAFFTINGLIFLTTHYYFLPKVSERNE